MPSTVAMLGVQLMDDDHTLIEALLARASITADEDLPALLAEIEVETRAHFTREEDLMRERSVPILHCHEQQHALFLDEFRPARNAVVDGDLAALRRFLTETLPGLFHEHVATVDTATASFLR